MSQVERETSDGPTVEVTRTHYDGFDPPATVDAGVGPGDQFGRYRIVSEIGRGGFGVVFRAEQIEGVRRQVALKLLLLGMDTEEVLGRFEREKRTLARLDHPGIASIHDAGRTPAGRPWFAMQYVRGIPIDAWCDRGRKTVAERVELMLQVCDAIEHAHQNGVIHRDITPANILVGDPSGAPRTTVIDFGIARSLQPDGLDDRIRTRIGGMIGTPAFMSPEQAELDGTDIDTRADIYSIGAVLYLLLTGQPPIDLSHVDRRTRFSLQKEIRRLEPDPPSTRLRSLDIDTRAAIAHARRTGAEELRRRLGSDLDWIVLKALEKDRARRYASVGALAADLRAFLEDRPTSVGHPSPAIRLRRSIRRHRGAWAVGSAVALGLAAIAGTATSAAAAARAEERRETQRRAEVEAAMYRQSLGLAAIAIARQEGAIAETALELPPDMALDWEHAMLTARADASIASFTAGTEELFGLDAVDGAIVALGGTRTIHRLEWDAGTRSLQSAGPPIDPGVRRITSVAVGRRINVGTGTTEQTIIVATAPTALLAWDFDTGERIELDVRWPAPVDVPPQVRAGREEIGDRLVVLAPDGTRTGRFNDLARLGTTQPTPNATAVAWQGDRAAYADVDPAGVARIGPLIAGSPRRSLDVDQPVRSLVYDGRPNGTAFAADGAGGLRMLVSKPNAKARVLQQHFGSALAAGIVAGPTGAASIAVSGGRDQALRMRDVTALAEPGAAGNADIGLLGHRGAIRGIAVDPADRSVVFTASADGTVRAWAADTRVGDPVISEDRGRCTGLSIDDGGVIHAIAHGEGDFQIVRDTTSTRTRDAAPGAIIEVAILEMDTSEADPPRHVALDVTGNVTVLTPGRTAEAMLARSNTAPNASIDHYAVAMDPSGTVVAVGEDREIHIWSRGRNGTWSHHPESTIEVRDRLAFDPALAWRSGDPNGNLWLAWASARGGVDVAPVAPGRPASVPVRRLTSPSEVTGLEWWVDADGIETMVGVSIERKIRVWTSTDQSTRAFDAPSHMLSLARHPTQPRIAVGGSDGLVHIFDTRDWQQIVTIPAAVFAPDPTAPDLVGSRRDRNGITELAFTPDGHTLAIVRMDGLVAVLDERSVRDRLP